MNREGTLSRAMNLVVLASVTAILLASLLLVHRAYERGLGSEIFRYTRELEDRVGRRVAGEFRRYFLLLDLAKSIRRDGEEGEFAALLEDKSRLLRDEGELPHLVSSIGYGDAGSAGKALEYTFEDETWHPRPELLSLLEERRSPRGMEILSLREPGDSPGEELFLVISRDKEQRILFFRLDTPAFLDQYVKESVEAGLPDFTVQWFFSREDHGESLSDYRFQPLKALFPDPAEGKSLILEIPGFIQPPREREDERAAAGEAEGAAGAAGPPDHPGIFHTGLYLRLSRDGGPYYQSIEQEGARNFLITATLLFAVGGVLLILLFQLERTKQLRLREKEFVASVTHELRTPLTVIRSAADNLATGIIPQEKLRRYSDLIQSHADRLGTMIEEILLYSGLEGEPRRSTRTDTPPVETDPSELLSRIRPGLEALAENTGIRLHWDVEGIPQRVQTHPDTVTLVLNNLVSNALGHAYPGVTDRTGTGKGVRIRLKTTFPEGLQISVEDEGRGIAPRELKQIFKPFYRDSVSRTRQEKGSGLGLFITRQKLLLSGGKLEVESPYRRVDGTRSSGCRFTATLPCFILEEPESHDGR